MHYSDIVPEGLRIWALKGLTLIEYALTIHSRGGKRDRDFSLFIDSIDTTQLTKYADRSQRMALVVDVFKRIADIDRYSWMTYIEPRSAVYLIRNGYIGAKLLEGLAMHKDSTLYPTLLPIWTAKYGSSPPPREMPALRDKKEKRKDKRNKKHRDVIPQPEPKLIQAPPPRVEVTYMLEAPNSEGEPLMRIGGSEAPVYKPPKHANAKKSGNTCRVM